MHAPSPKIPKAGFTTIVLSRKVGKGYETREAPVLVVGEHVVVPSSPSLPTKKPWEITLKGYIAKPIASDHSALGPRKGYVSGRTIEDLQTWFQYEKGGTARYLFYVPVKFKEFTVFILHQSPIRFTVEP